MSVLGRQGHTKEIKGHLPLPGLRCLLFQTGSDTLIDGGYTLPDRAACRFTELSCQPHCRCTEEGRPPFCRGSMLCTPNDLVLTIEIGMVGRPRQHLRSNRCLV